MTLISGDTVQEPRGPRSNRGVIDDAAVDPPSPLPVGLLLALVVAAPAVADFVTFESGQVRPLALSADGSRLFTVNTPDTRLEIFDVTAAGLTHRAAVSVGLEPVAVAVRSASEVWVVNHLSDSVSIVDVAADPPRVVRTLLVGDEPATSCSPVRRLPRVQHHGAPGTAAHRSVARERARSG